MLTDREILDTINDAPFANGAQSFLLSVGRAVEAKVLEKQRLHLAGVLDLVKDYGRYRNDGLHESAERELAAIEQALAGPAGVSGTSRVGTIGHVAPPGFGPATDAFGVPAFDEAQPCVLKTNDPTRTYCTRCKNPHHACDGGGVSPSEVSSFDVEAMLRECVPAGSFFGSLKVANAIRAYFARGVGVGGEGQPDFPRIEPCDWQLIDPQGRVAATESSCIKAWARVNGYKPTVENLLGYEQNGWRVQPVSRGVKEVDRG